MGGFLGSSSPSWPAILRTQRALKEIGAERHQISIGQHQCCELKKLMKKQMWQIRHGALTLPKLLSIARRQLLRLTIICGAAHPYVTKLISLPRGCLH